MKIYIIKKSKKVPFHLIIVIILLFSGLLTIYSFNFLSTTGNNIPLMTPISPSIKAAQGSKNDDQNDFYYLLAGGKLPSGQEPDPRYDLKRLSYDADGAINLTVWGTLDVNDGNMTNADPFWISFKYQNEIHGIQIGTGASKNDSKIRAYLTKMSETEIQLYWNGSDWVDFDSFNGTADDDSWDLCSTQPNGTSKVIIDIPSDTGIVLANAQFAGTFINPFYPHKKLHYGAMSVIYTGDDYILDIITFPIGIDPILFLLFSQTSEPSVIPGYPSVIFISTTIIIILMVLVILQKKNLFTLI